MSVEQLRNVKTGEFRDVETNSDEYVELINEVYDHDGSARPKWEITGRHHTARVDEGVVQEEDHGYEDKPVPGSTVTVGDLRPEEHPERALTEAEVDAGIESYEQKMESLGVKPVTTQAEPLERTDPGDRLETGRQKVGSTGGKQRSRRSRSGAGATATGGTAGGGTTSGAESGSGSSEGSNT